MLFNRLPLISALALCALICGSIYIQLAPIFIQDLKKDLKPTTPSSSVAQTNTNKPQKTHNISKFSLFGDVNKAISKPKPVAKDLPKTSLKLLLTGVMASGNNANASALIQGPDKQTLNYRINDELPGGATLKQVYPDRVVLERSGRLENLVFVEQRPIGFESYEPVDDPEIEETENTENNPIITTRAANPGRTQGIKDRLSKLRKRMLKNRVNQ